MAEFVGDGGVTALDDFWRRGVAEPWLAQHPLAHDTQRLIPTLWHYDGLEIFSNTEYYVWSWRSAVTESKVDMGRSGPPLLQILNC